MDSKVCIVCNTEKRIDSFYKKYRQCKQCNIQRSLKQYYENKDKLSDQRIIFCEKNREVSLAKSTINQQNRKSHTQQIKDLSKKAEEVTKMMETLIFKIE